MSSGADAVKFQVFDVDALIASQSQDWKNRLSTRQLPYSDFIKIQSYALRKGIDFFATAHDPRSFEFLKTLDLPCYKIGSGELGNLEYIKDICMQGKPVIISVGMYSQAEIDSLFELLCQLKNPDIAILHCVTNYPADPSEIALQNITHLRNKYNIVTGYSDHTKGFHIPLGAVALGASIVEKHITLDYDIPDAQDWKVSCGPSDLKLFVDQVRDLEKALPERLSGPTDSELASKVWATKSLVAARNLSKGDVLVSSDVVVKRPGGGLKPNTLSSLLGKQLAYDIPVDSLFKMEDFQ